MLYIMFMNSFGKKPSYGEYSDPKPPEQSTRDENQRALLVSLVKRAIAARDNNQQRVESPLECYLDGMQELRREL